MIRVQVVVLDPGAAEALSSLGSPAAREAVALSIMDGARSKLVSLAGEKLRSSRMDYLQGIQPLAVDEDGVALVLAGALPLMVEHGWDERSLHETLLHNPAARGKVRETADGKRYRFIPFRHKTPGTTHQGGQPMGSQYGPAGALSKARPKNVVADTASLGKRIHKAAKKLKAGQSLPSGLAPKLRDDHSTDIFSGMRVNLQSVQKRGGAPGQVGFQRTYVTFRTISDAQPDKWHHPGIAARNFFDDVERYVRDVAPAAVEAFLQSTGGK